MWYILNEDGEPVPEPDVIKASALLAHDRRRVLAIDFIERADHVAHVSTVFLGLDHSFGGGRPVLWETMIFGGPNDLFQNRYTSKADALEGHKRAVSIAKGECPDET